MTTLRQRKTVENMMIDLKINPDLADEMQEHALRPADSVHRERASCWRSNGWTWTKYGVFAEGDGVRQEENGREIAETMCQLEERYRSWKQDIAYLTDIGGLWFQRPDDGLDRHGLRARWGAQKEISMKQETSGKKGQQFEDHTAHDRRRIIQREKDRGESRKDRKWSGKVAAVADGGHGDCSNFEQLVAKEEVEKEKGKERQTVSASCVTKKAIFKAQCSNRWCVP